MKKFQLSFAFVIGSLMCLWVIGCQKPNSASDNNNVIEIPYSLYFGDSTGSLYSTNDGVIIQKVPFSADGNPFRAILVSKTNILFSKENRSLPVRDNTHLYYSSNGGADFNISYDSIKSLPGVAINGMHYDLYQNSIVDIPKWNRVYVLSNDNSPNDYFGLQYSYQNGAWGSWTPEVYYNGNRMNVPFPLTITSLTVTKGTVLYALDAIQHRTIYRSDTFTTTVFNETTSNIYGPGVPLPTTGFFSLGHYNEELIAFDNSGINGAYFSDDSGYTWAPFTGLPANTPLFCCSAPFEEQCFIGTGGAGVYILNINSHSFQPANNGLPVGCVVRGVVGKENIYKNGNVSKYVFAATDKGIYKSSDLGENWTKVVGGNYTAIY
jgi:hypothetical protein